MAIRKGAPKAVMALAHHLIVVVHQVLSRKEEYVEFGGDSCDRRNRSKTVALVERLKKLGFEVDLKRLAEPTPGLLAAQGEPEEAVPANASSEG